MHDGTAYVRRAKDSMGENFHSYKKKHLSLETFHRPASCKFHHKNNKQVPQHTGETFRGKG